MDINPLSMLIPVQQVESEIDHYRWGTIQKDGSVLLDTDTGPLADQPPSLVTYAVGDRVFVLIHNRRAVILGKAYPSAFDESSIPDSTATQGQIPGDSQL